MVCSLVGFPAFADRDLVVDTADYGSRFVLSKDRFWGTGAWTIILAGSLVWQLSHVIEFSPLWSKEVPVAAKGSPTIKLMVSNLDYENTKPNPVQQQLEGENPDVLLLVEYDQDWHSRLSDLRSKFEFHHEEIRGEGLGMALWSHLPITESETKFSCF